MTAHLHRDKPVTLGAVLAQQRRRTKASRWAWLAGLGAGIASLPMLFSPATDGPIRVPLAVSGVRQAMAAAPSFHADCSAPATALKRDLAAIAQSFDGKIGIAVTKAGCDWVVGHQQAALFPQQSVSKLWVSLGVLDAVDKGRLGLADPLTIRPADLTLFNQPLRAAVLEHGQAVRSVRSLMSDAISHSDNTANDRLLWTLGGPETIRAALRRMDIDGIRFGPGERLMQSGIAGLEWHPQLSIGRNFEQARAALPIDRRKAALAHYVADPIDGAQPAAIATALARLAAGQLLSPSSTQVMMDLLAATRSGPRRLKAGAPAGWKVYHKTGTGQELAGIATGYNDVGLLQAPDGSFYGVAVMIAQTRQPIPVRMEAMQDVSKAIARFHQTHHR